MSRFPSGWLEKDLEKIYRHNLGVHAADTLRLDALRGLLAKRGMWSRSSRQTLSDCLTELLRSGIADAELTPELKKALMVDFALGVAVDAVQPYKQRAQMAAIAAECSYDTYTHSRANRGIARRKFAMQRLVKKLDPEGVYNEAPPGTTRSRPRADSGGGRASEPKDAPIDPPSPSQASQANQCYRHVQDENLQLGFWWRPSTRDYLEQIVSQPTLTIFAGSDGPADLGPPLHADVMLAMLRDCLNDDPLLGHLDRSAGRDAADRLIDAVRASGASAGRIGSMVRGLYAARPSWEPEDTEVRLRNVIQSTAHGRVNGGFVAAAITRLAFALRGQGVPVTVVSVHYDSDLVQSAQELAERLPATASCSYDILAGRLPDGQAPDGHVPLVTLNSVQRVAQSGRMAVGEADLLLDDGTRSATSPAAQLERLFSEAGTLFVGTSLTDPGVLSAVARTRHLGLPRYALLPSPISEDMHPQTLIADEDRARLLAIFASRYRYLGVIPIVIDFRSQVPQLLLEAAARVAEGNDYVYYTERIDRWWERWAESFGYGPEGDRASARAAEQERWHSVLRQLRDTIIEEFIDNSGSAGREDVMIEVWLRNPGQAARYLFRWASSEDVWDRSATAPVAYLSQIGDITQKTFREGQSFWRSTHGADMGRWMYCVAMNLVLDSAEWKDLPVGVVKVFSTSASGRLHEIKNGESGERFERLIVGKARQLFDGQATSNG